VGLVKLQDLHLESPFDRYALLAQCVYSHCMYMLLQYRQMLVLMCSVCAHVCAWCDVVCVCVVCESCVWCVVCVNGQRSKREGSVSGLKGEGLVLSSILLLEVLLSHKIEFVCVIFGWLVFLCAVAAWEDYIVAW